MTWAKALLGTIRFTNMRAQEFLTEKWVIRSKSGSVEYGIGDHFMDQWRSIPERQVPWKWIEKIIKRLPYIKPQLDQMLHHPQFYLHDTDTGLELGCRISTFGEKDTRLVYVNTLVMRNKHFSPIRKSDTPTIVVNAPKISKKSPEVSVNPQLDESIKDWITAASIGMMAAGGGGAAYDAWRAQQTPQAVTAPATVPQPAPLPQKKMGKIEGILSNVAQKAGIAGTELKQFLAQCAHESANFTSLEEIGTPKYFARKYDKRFSPKKAKALGNVKPGDGAKYKGRGYIQLTGRYNYAKAGQELGLPLEQHPELAARPDIAAKIAVWFWQNRVKPRVQNFTDVPQSTKPINPSMAGLPSRQAKFDQYAQVSIPPHDQNSVVQK